MAAPKEAGVSSPATPPASAGGPARERAAYIRGRADQWNMARAPYVLPTWMIPAEVRAAFEADAARAYPDPEDTSDA